MRKSTGLSAWYKFYFFILDYLWFRAAIYANAKLFAKYYEVFFKKYFKNAINIVLDQPNQFCLIGQSYLPCHWRHWWKYLYRKVPYQIFQSRFQAVDRICSIVLGLCFQIPKSCFGSNVLSPLVMLGRGGIGDDCSFIVLMFSDLSTWRSCSISWIPDTSIVTVIIY